MFTEAVAAARAGDRSQARELFSQLLRGDSSNVEYWIWMSSLVDSHREKAYCLDSAVRLDPTNRAVLRAIVVLGIRPLQDGERLPPLRLPRRAAAYASAPVARAPVANFNWILLGGSAIGLVFLAGAGYVLVQLIRPRGATIAPTLAPVSPTAGPDVSQPSATPIPVETRILRTPIPTELAGTPLVFFVPATATPTPLLGLTPHPSFEAYAAGVSAILRGDYEGALTFLDQVVDLSPELADVHYLRGEALRRLGRTGEAINAFDRAILLNENLAPAYVGRGLTLMERRPEDLPADFDKAIALDPLYADAYLAKADYQAAQLQWKTMEETLQAAIDAGVRSPVVYIRMSEAQLNRERYVEALESAITGSANDPSYLEGYLAVGSAYVELEEYGQALAALQTYVAYAPQDHRGWAYLGRAQWGSAQPELAMVALNRALELNDRYAPAYVGRGYVNLTQGDSQAALSDFERARQYGRGTWLLTYGFAQAWYRFGEYPVALRWANDAIETSPNDRKRAEAYAIRAIIYEDTNPPLVDDAVFTWNLILGLAEASPETRSLAEAHLQELTGVGPTRTPTSSATVGLPATTTPEGLATPTPLPLPTLTPTPTPLPTPFPTPTEDPREHEPI
jgi:tetratricopeptide (TPR) repeat protein